jgi:predicted porin
VDLESVEAKGGASPATRRTRLTDHPSVLGVRGSEDLGGGLKAVFQLETAFQVDERAAGAFAARNSMAGLQGGWGTFGVGRWDMPLKQSIGATDLWGDINKADWTTATADQGNFSTRLGNSVMYWSPNWSGFQLKLHYVTDENRNAAVKPEATGASVTWARGPLYLALAYEEHKQMTGSQAGVLVTTPGYKEEGTAVGGHYTMGNFKLAAHYGEYKKPAGQTAAQVAAGTLKDKSYYVGGQYTAGKNVFLVTYQNAEVGSADCDAVGAGYQYVFSKRTNIMFSYVKIDNSGGMNCNFGAGSSLGTGEDPEGFGIGIRHYF